MIILELGSLEALEVAMTPSPPPLESCHLPAFVDSGCVLAPNSEVLFGIDLCNFLIILEVATPGNGKKIASALAGETFSFLRERKL
jgi:hypothetical protein